MTQCDLSSANSWAQTLLSHFQFTLTAPSEFIPVVLPTSFDFCRTQALRANFNVGCLRGDSIPVGPVVSTPVEDRAIGDEDDLSDDDQSLFDQLFAPDTSFGSEKGSAPPVKVQKGKRLSGASSSEPASKKGRPGTLDVEMEADADNLMADVDPYLNQLAVDDIANFNHQSSASLLQKLEDRRLKCEKFGWFGIRDNLAESIEDLKCVKSLAKVCASADIFGKKPKSRQIPKVLQEITAARGRKNVSKHFGPSLRLFELNTMVDVHLKARNMEGLEDHGKWSSPSSLRHLRFSGHLMTKAGHNHSDSLAGCRTQREGVDNFPPVIEA